MALPRLLVWNEYRQERSDPKVGAVYPDGIHAAVADGLRDAGFDVRTATLDAVIHAKQRALGEARAGRKKSTDSTHKGAIPGSASLPPCAAPAKPARERRFADHTGNGGPADAGLSHN